MGHEPCCSVTMSFGPAASAAATGGAMLFTMAISKMTHNMIIGAGEQPVTVCAEFEAGTIVRNMAKPMESHETKRMMLNPIRSSSINAETGRATGKFMYTSGDSVCREVSLSELLHQSVAALKPF